MTVKRECKNATDKLGTKANSKESFPCFRFVSLPQGKSQRPVRFATVKLQPFDSLRHNLGH